MFFVSLFSVKLSRQHNKCSESTRARTHGKKIDAVAVAARYMSACSHRRQI